MRLTWKYFKRELTKTEAKENLINIDHTKRWEKETLVIHEERDRDTFECNYDCLTYDLPQNI